MMRPAPGELTAWALRRVLFIVMAGVMPLLWAPTLAAAEFSIKQAEIFLSDKVYHLNADIEYSFSDAALEGLQNGVPLVVVVEIEINRQRDYWWNESVASLRQRYQLAYEALTDRYVLTNLNSGADGYYPTRAAAISALGDVDDVPLLDAGLLDERELYNVALRASLDLDALPVPMRVMGYFSSDWRLSSEWRTWPLR